MRPCWPAGFSSQSCSPISDGVACSTSGRNTYQTPAPVSPGTRLTLVYQVTSSGSSSVTSCCTGTSARQQAGRQHNAYGAVRGDLTRRLQHDSRRSVLVVGHRELRDTFAKPTLVQWELEILLGPVGSCGPYTAPRN